MHPAPERWSKYTIVVFMMRLSEPLITDRPHGPCSSWMLIFGDFLVLIFRNYLIFRELTFLALFLELTNGLFMYCWFFGVFNFLGLTIGCFNYLSSNSKFESQSSRSHSIVDKMVMEMRGEKIPMSRGKGWKYSFLPNNVGKKSVNNAETQQDHNSIVVAFSRQ